MALPKGWTKKEQEQRSRCHNAPVYYAPSYYCTTMKTSDEKEIPEVAVCTKCGHECDISKI